MSAQIYSTSVYNHFTLTLEGEIDTYSILQICAHISEKAILLDSQFSVHVAVFAIRPETQRHRPTNVCRVPKPHQTLTVALSDHKTDLFSNGEV